MKILKRFVLGTALVLATPSIAQDRDLSPAEEQEMMAELTKMFAVEPLTAEEEARLPLAGKIIDRMIPPGTLGEMMGPMFDDIMKPIMERASSKPKGDLARQLGVPASSLDMSDAEIVEAADMLDPVREERNARLARVFPLLMSEMMTAIEPSMRKAMTEAYAINFDQRELTEIDAFFSTETGLNFARKSFTMSTDPRVIGASMEAMPAMMQSFAKIEQKMKDATADLPPVRGYADLSSKERKRLAELLGMSQGELEETMP